MAFSEQVPSETYSQLLDQAIECILERLRSSQDAPLDDIVRLFPQVEQELREIYPALLLADQLGGDSAGRTPSIGGDVSAAVDKELIYAAFAMQCGVLRLHDFLLAFEAWNVDRSASIKQLLFDRDFIPNEARSLLDGLFEQQSSLGRIAEGSTVDFAGVRTSRRGPEEAIESRDGIANSSERYRFVRPLDRGGLGVVSVALDQELNREVAIKEIREDRVDNIYLRNKFLLEAQVTGGLEHPGIVPIYGFGHSLDGRPYYAMRLINGNNLRLHIQVFHQNVTQNRLTYNGPQLRRLLRRFIDVCHAIEYAHSRGILHRDIKPVNIMLGRYGETLVVDWGLAKAVGESLQIDSGYQQSESMVLEPERPLTPSGSDEGSQTRQGSVVGTPVYASPEQLMGQVALIGVASDVYSLGATLFELLCGQAAVSGSLLEILRAVTSGKIPSPRAIQPMVPKPLESVCMKAMAFDPADRYASAQHLRLEIERWLDDDPVYAFPEPWHLRARRWLRKNPTIAATIGASALIMTIGLTSFSAILSQKNRSLAQLNSQLDGKNTQLAASNQQLDRSVLELAESNQREITAREIAQDQSELALSTLSSVILDIQAGLKNLPRGSEVRRRLLSTALDRLDQVAIKVAEKATADRSTMVALIDIGELIVQFGTEPNSQLVSLASAKITTDDAKSTARMALRALERAEEIAVARHKQIPQDPQAISDLERVIRATAVIHARLGDTLMALEMSQTSIGLTQSLVSLEPDNTLHRRTQATAIHQYGDLLLRSGRDAEAKESFEQVLAIFRDQMKGNQDDPLNRENIAFALEFLADAEFGLEELAKADAQFEESIVLLRELDQTQVTRPGQATALARVLWKQSLCRLRMGHISGAELAIAESRRLYQAAASQDPNDANLAMFLSNVLEREGVILENAAKLDLAVAKTAESLDIRQGLLKLDPADALRARQASISQDRLGLLELQRGNPDEAKKHFQAALQIAKKLAEEDPTHAAKQRDYYLSQGRIAKLLEQLGQFEQALEFRRQAIPICESLSKQKPDDLIRKRDWMLALAEGAATFAKAGQLTEAERLHLQALRLSDELLRARPDSTT